ncbi:hypothetical protein WH47_06508 [Habropoda laboriosa]|uniref:Uncharacterized protein n=1 Tax=Habropoda laboriosa TaxID=597456 RepID=A0A0L7RD88_9HYME|nr:hypothetical protein WH47_06508 [Habropoda laboriosa]
MVVSVCVYGSVSKYGCSWSSGDDWCTGFHYSSVGHGCSDVGRSGDQRALDGYFVGVGVAGGDWDGVRYGEWSSGDHRSRMDGGRSSQETWCRFRCRGSQRTGEESEQSDEFVHGYKCGCCRYWT